MRTEVFIKISLVIVYIWFGVLKILGVSPVESLIKDTYPWLPEPQFIIVLGLWELMVGILLLSKKTLKIGIILMWLQMGGIFLGLIINPSIYFQNMNLLLLTTEGEFVIKNLVLLSASYVLWKKNR